MTKPAINRKPDPIDRHPDDLCHGDEWLRKVNPIDPRNIDHPSHDEDWLEMARAIGRAMADHDWDRINGPDKEPE